MRREPDSVDEKSLKFGSLLRFFGHGINGQRPQVMAFVSQIDLGRLDWGDAFLGELCWPQMAMLG